ncbi:CoA transferase subunit A [Chloroflexota bacterium]
MPIDKIVASFDEAVADIPDGATIMVGGFATVASAPSFLLQALARKGVKNLTSISNTGGFGPDIWAIQGYKVTEDIDILARNGMVKKVIVSAPSSIMLENNLGRQIKAGEVEAEKVPLGTLTERIRSAKAGIGAFYVPVGAGTVVQEGKETRIIDGRLHLLEYAIHADFALIKAHKADRWGNLTYRKATRTVNETMAGAAKLTIVEVDEIVELGELDPEAIVTPGVYIDRVVQRPQNTDESKAEDDKEIDPRFTESHQKFMETWKGKPKKEG